MDWRDKLIMVGDGKGWAGDSVGEGVMGWNGVLAEKMNGDIRLCGMFASVVL